MLISGDLSFSYDDILHLPLQKHDSLVLPENRKFKGSVINRSLNLVMYTYIHQLEIPLNSNVI